MLKTDFGLYIHNNRAPVFDLLNKVSYHIKAGKSSRPVEEALQRNIFLLVVS